MVEGHGQSRKYGNLKDLATCSIFLLLSLVFTACGGSSSSEETAGSSGDGSSSGVSGNTTNPDCGMTSNEQAMLQQVNAARSQSRKCGSTQYTAVAPLQWDCKLQQAALSHSRDMAENNFFDHTGSNGLGPSFRIEQQGYQARTWGENIAMGYTTIENVVDAWLNSTGHCRNIMNSSFTDLGMALVENSGSNYRIYWTQVFGTPVQQTVQASAVFQTSSGHLGGTDVVQMPVTEK